MWWVRPASAVVRMELRFVLLQVHPAQQEQHQEYPAPDLGLGLVAEWLEHVLVQPDRLQIVLLRKLPV